MKLYNRSAQMVYQMHWTAGMLTRPAGHEAKAEAEARCHEAEIEAKKSEAEA